MIKPGASTGLVCLLYVSGTVQDADYYTFTFSRRGDLSYSRDDLAKRGWWLSLSLGNQG